MDIEFNNMCKSFINNFDTLILKKLDEEDHDSFK
jgi:hypothetical protein